jgi:hypothetical protein
VYRQKGGKLAVMADGSIRRRRSARDGVQVGLKLGDVEAVEAPILGQS